jgi:hypothetical protein
MYLDHKAAAKIQIRRVNDGEKSLIDGHMTCNLRKRRCPTRGKTVEKTFLLLIMILAEEGLAREHRVGNDCETVAMIARLVMAATMMTSME